jgi:hypothetical protein
MSGSKSSGSGGVGSVSGARSEAAALEPVALTVHSLPTPALADDPRVRHGRIKMLLVLLVCAAPVIASYFTYYVIRPQGGTQHGELIDPQRPLPAAQSLPLTDLRGGAVAPASLQGQWLFIVVAGGACDALCERQLYLQRQLRETLGKNKDRVDRVWLVDDEAPVRDALAPALAGVTVLRAPREALAQWLQSSPGHGLADHFHMVDPLGNYMMRFPAPSDAGRIKRDLDRLMRASASWDEPGRAAKP